MYVLMTWKTDDHTYGKVAAGLSGIRIYDLRR